jgi:hypothetical protein
MSFGASSWGAEAWGSPLVFVPIIYPKVLMAKTQFESNEALQVIFPPFYDTVNNQYVTTGLDNVTLTVKQPDDTLLGSPPTPSFDANTHFWEAIIPIGSFQSGEWLVRASSDAPDTLDQYRVFTWGDYVDKIVENNQAAYGRWKIENDQLTIYASDGVTPLKVFDLKDESGLPTQTRIFERDPL